METLGVVCRSSKSFEEEVEVHHKVAMDTEREEDEYPIPEAVAVRVNILRVGKTRNSSQLETISWRVNNLSRMPSVPHGVQRISRSDGEVASIRLFSKDISPHREVQISQSYGPFREWKHWHYRTINRTPFREGQGHGRTNFID